ncbi:MAG: hypothetical protein AAFQ90_04700 [Pseudomonadota bacterium]
MGWFSSVLARTDEPGAILQQMGLGLVASFGFGIAFNTGSALGGLTWTGLIASIVGGALALGIYYALVTRAKRSDQTGGV